MVAGLSHPNIVALFDVGDGYLVTELVDGEPVSGKVGVARALEIAAEIADGVAAAHEAGIVHRDLKPANILVRRDGRVKILDFGLAKVRGRPAASAANSTETLQTNPGAVMGTAGYMSPEQVRGSDVDARSDIFNIGLILHEVLTGQRAFRGDTGVEVMAAILKRSPRFYPNRSHPRCAGLLHGVYKSNLRIAFNRPATWRSPCGSAYLRVIHHKRQERARTNGDWRPSSLSSPASLSPSQALSCPRTGSPSENHGCKCEWAGRR